MSFETKGMQQEDMKIQLESILPSLAKSLYGDDWRISIRELLQNCHDAFFVGGMQLEAAEIHIVPDRAKGTLSFRDNGVGMTREEVKDYLATVGAGYKRKQIEELKKKHGTRVDLDKVIGQYGIGFLSSFIIADKVEVRTKSSTNKDAPGVRSIFTGETRWYVEERSDIRLGTEIILELKKTPLTDPETGENKSVHELLNFENLKSQVKRFGDLLPIPIYVHRSPEDLNGDLCNAMRWPWEGTGIASLDELLRFHRNRHTEENEPIHATSFTLTEENDGVRAEGTIYFPRKPQEKLALYERSGEVELFCRRMFISDRIPALLPEWAVFVTLVVECPSLTPTLDRNDVIRHDPAFVALKQGITRKLTQTLKLLAEKQPRTFQEFLGIYRYDFYYALASDFKDSPQGKEVFFRTMIEFLPFIIISRTKPAGEEMTLPKYRQEMEKRIPNQQLALESKDTDEKESKLDEVKPQLPIYFLFDPISAAQYRAMIVKRDIPVILITSDPEHTLLNAYGHAHDDVTVVDVRQILDRYVEEVDQKPYTMIKEFLSKIDAVGADEVKAVRFDPSYVPAIMTVSNAADPQSAKLLEKMLREGGSVMSSKVRATLQRELNEAKLGKLYITVQLNEQNSLIRKIKTICASGVPMPEYLADVLHEIYHNARMYADPREADSEHYFDYRNRLMEEFIESHEALVAEKDKLVAEKDKSDRLSSQLDAVKKRTEARVPSELKSRTCAMLLTDLKASVKMIGFLDNAAGATILREYASIIGGIVDKHQGIVDRFTGDGLFAHFGLEQLDFPEAIQAAADCAFEILGETARFFNRESIRATLLDNGGIEVNGSRTVLHSGAVMYGGLGGKATILGRQVAVLFRACEQDKLFETSNIILTAPFHTHLKSTIPLQPVAEKVRIDSDLPEMTFYPHPALVSGLVSGKKN